MTKTIVLAKRPDLVLKLEKYNLIPEGRKGGIYEGIAKKWAKEKAAPYNTAEYQALAARLPTGWEELTLKEMEALLKKLKQVIEDKKQEKLDVPNKGPEKMLKNLAEMAFIAISSISALLAENGLGRLPDQDEKEREMAIDLTFELIFCLIDKAGLLTAVFRNISKTADTSRKNQELIAEALKLAAIFFAALAASKKSQTRLHQQILSFKKTFKEGVDKIESFVSEKLADGAIEGKGAERSALYLQEVKTALEREDFDGFIDAFTGVLRMLGFTKEDFLKDIENIRIFAKTLRNSILATTDSSQNQFSTISQAM